MSTTYTDMSKFAHRARLFPRPSPPSSSAHAQDSVCKNTRKSDPDLPLVTNKKIEGITTVARRCSSTISARPGRALGRIARLRPLLPLLEFVLGRALRAHPLPRGFACEVDASEMEPFTLRKKKKREKKGEERTCVYAFVCAWMFGDVKQKTYR